MAQYRAIAEVEFFDRETLAVDSTTVTSRLANRQNDADYALITIETDQIRWNPLGLNASATDHLASVADIIELEGPANIRNFRAVMVTGTANLRVSYGRWVRPT